MNGKFLKPNDPILTKVAKRIPKNQFNSFQTKRIIETMLKVAYGEQKDSKKPIMVGFAAPQIGISRRIILVDTKADGGGKFGNLSVFVNPRITWYSKEEKGWYEGCFSTSRVCGIVKRPTSIKIKALKLISRRVATIPLPMWKLNEVEEKYSGYTARIFQHEIDHLNGRFFVDHIKDPNKLHWVLKKEFPLYRNKKAWKNWSRKCSFERWKRIQKSSII